MYFYFFNIYFLYLRMLTKHKFVRETPSQPYIFNGKTIDYVPRLFDLIKVLIQLFIEAASYTKSQHYISIELYILCMNP